MAIRKKADRAKLFIPFDALKGLKEALREKESEIELPPYHPGCMCEVVYYEKEDILEEL